MHLNCITLFTSWKTETLHLLSNNFSFSASHFSPANTSLLSVSINLSTVSTLYMWKHKIIFCVWLAYFTEHNVLKIHPRCSLCQNFLPFKDWIAFTVVQITFPLSFHPSMNTWVAFILWLLWTLLLQTWVYKYLFKSLFLILLGIYPGVELVNHEGVLFLIFWEIAILPSIVAAPFHNPPNSAQGFQLQHICTKSWRFFFFFFQIFFYSSQPNGCEVTLHCAFDFFSLRISDGGHVLQMEMLLRSPSNWLHGK